MTRQEKMDISEQIKRFQEFFESYYRVDLLEQVRKGKKFYVADFTNLIKFDPELSELLLDEPEEVIKAGELAIEQYADTKNIRLRFTNLPESQNVAIRNIRSEHINKLIVIDGMVRQASDVRPQVVNARFECPSCGNTISILQVDTKFKEPSRCSCGRKGKFRLLDRELVDAQRLLIEENPEAMEGGDQPKRMSAFLKEDLVEPKMEKKTTPGNRVKLTGIVKEIPVILASGVQSVRFDLVIETNYLEAVAETFDTIEISKEDEEEIKKLSKNKKVYEKLINSISPSVYGYEDIKGAMILQLMGGVMKKRKDGTKTRGDIHILLVGDPGAAKSTLLTFMNKAAPKSRYVAGKSASGTGMTATVVKDEFLRGWALEAGAIVLASGGICCIDEMDKMSDEDTSSLHEALAQQTVSISKANIQATLRAETSVLAAANPKLGRFDPYEPIAQQINLPPTLINRFDLIFPVRDIPDRDNDERIATHVLKLQQSDELSEPELDPLFLKKYVAYSRQRIFPKLTEEALEEIKEFYVSLRNTGTTESEGLQPIPISARQLDSLVRLAEGAARIRLSKKVTKEDAKKAIALLQRCLMAVGYDKETGKIDIDRITTGIATSERSKIIIVREIINALEEKLGKTLPIDEVIKEADLKGVKEKDVEEIIERMKRQGDIYEPRSGIITKL